MVHVCSNFFVFVLQKSLNKLYQPTVEGQAYSVEMAGYRNSHLLADYGAAEAVEVWLKNYAQGHLHDPTEPKIILSVPSRKIVYDLFKEDFEKRCNLIFFPKNAQGVHYLPSKSYFYRCWSSIPTLKNIILRKYLRFALCEECMFLRDRRRFSTSEAERKEIAAREKYITGLCTRSEALTT
jgi:hypothetical protein